MAEPSEIKTPIIEPFKYTRERRRFGRECDFNDTTQYLYSIQSSIRRRFHFVLRNPISRSTQIGKQFADSTVETHNPEFIEHGMLHEEGGWPKDVNTRDEEQTLRYRKKIEREDEWGPQVLHMIHETETVLAQNSAVNIYEDFYSDLQHELGQVLKRCFEARSSHTFHDSMQLSRPVTVINWSSSVLKNFLVQYTNYGAISTDDNISWKEFESDVMSLPRRLQYGISLSDDAGSHQTDWTDDCTDNAFFVWDYENPLRPVTILDSDDIVRRACFCPKDNYYVAGAFQSGSVAIWNTKENVRPLQFSPLETSHREPVSAICWVHSKSNSEFFSGSSDGSVKHWDARSLTQPNQELFLDPNISDEQSRADAEGVSFIEFEYTIPVRYIVASDHGRVFVGNRKGTTPSESLFANYRLFSGPIHFIERNPFFVKNFLISADWCARIWAEECKNYATSLVFKRKNEVLCASWSTTRCSLLVTGDEKGNVDFWDLLLNQREPIYSMVFESSVYCLTFRSDGEFLAVGLETGQVYLVEIEVAMRSCTSKDKALTSSLFEREQLRCKLLEGRVEEVKLKKTLAEKAIADKAAAEAALAEAGPQPILNPEEPEDFLRIIEADIEVANVLSNFKEVCFALDKKRQERIFVMEYTDFEAQMDYIEPQYQEEDDEPMSAAQSPPLQSILEVQPPTEGKDKKKKKKKKK